MTSTELLAFVILVNLVLLVAVAARYFEIRSKRVAHPSPDQPRMVAGAAPGSATKREPIAAQIGPTGVVATSLSQGQKLATFPDPGWYSTPSEGGVHYWNGTAWSEPPGWYPFPSEGGELRYWDGEQWATAPRGWYSVPGEAGVDRYWNGTVWTGFRGRRLPLVGWTLLVGQIALTALVILWYSRITHPPGAYWYCVPGAEGPYWLPWLVLCLLSVGGWVNFDVFGRGHWWMIALAVAGSIIAFLFCPILSQFDCAM
jgi:hypothetical protein